MSAGGKEYCSRSNGHNWTVHLGPQKLVGHNWTAGAQLLGPQKLLGHNWTAGAQLLGPQKLLGHNWTVHLGSTKTSNPPLLCAAAAAAAACDQSCLSGVVAVGCRRSFRNGCSPCSSNHLSQTSPSLSCLGSPLSLRLNRVIWEQLTLYSMQGCCTACGTSVMWHSLPSGTVC